MAQENQNQRQKASVVLDTSSLIDGERGVTTVFNIIEFPPALSDCTVLMPTREDYEKSLSIATRLRLIGKPIGTIDILIASMCINRKKVLQTKDKDFLQVKLVEENFTCKS